MANINEDIITQYLINQQYNDSKTTYIIQIMTKQCIIYKHNKFCLIIVFDFDGIFYSNLISDSCVYQRLYYLV